MSQLYGVDVSQFQPNINWDSLNAAANFVIIRAAYGTVTDPLFSTYQADARSEAVKAGPLGIGYYYFAYPTLLDPITSANYFASTVGALEEGEVLMLDLEGNIGPTPVTWALQFLQRVEAVTGVKPLIYLNQSEVSGYNWSPVIQNGNGLWLADYDGNKSGPGVSTPWPVTAVRQWTDKDTVAGVPETVDGDTFYGGFNAFEAYGYRPATPPVESPSTPVATEPTPEPQPAVTSTAPTTPVTSATPPATITLPVANKPTQAVQTPILIATMAAPIPSALMVLPPKKKSFWAWLLSLLHISK